MNANSYLLFFLGIIFVTGLITSFQSYREMKKSFEKKIKLDISLEQMLESEAKIRNFLKENNFQSNVSIEKIAEKLMIECGGTKDDLNDRASLSTPNQDGKMIVVFKKGLRKKEQRFDFAHECGHRINGDPAPLTRPEGYNKPKIEQLADYVGAALLMPIDRVYDFLIMNDYKGSSLKKRRLLLHELCEEYEVTEVIALRRIKEVFVIKGALIEQ